jgi:hypothetical protein
MVACDGYVQSHHRQEDLVLLRVADEPGPRPQEAQHAMSAACVVFSFQGLQERLSATMLRIHAPVPGFQQDLDRLLARTFTALQVRWNPVDYC